MNEQAILHIPDSKYCFASGPSEVVLRLRLARNERVDRVLCLYAGKYEFAVKRETAALHRVGSDRLFDYYAVRLRLTDLRLVYVFLLEADGKTRYYSEDGLTDCFDFTLSYYNCFQLPYLSAADLHPMVEWMQEAVFYEIFVDRFRRGSAAKDDSYVNLRWGDKPTPKSFAGGDILGIAQKLDYLKNLGVNALYLTPIFPSVSNHKYDIKDYYGIDPQFGTEADFAQLVERAHAVGIRVVLDAVFNHCSMELPQFCDAVKRGAASPYYDWFCTRNGEAPDPARVNYECFATCGYMPKWNTSNPEVQSYLLDVAAYWIERYDIDGWRLDVSDEVSHDFWRAFRKRVKAVKPDCVILGENWHDANPYLRGDQYDGIMNYAFTKACLDYFATGDIDAQAFSERLTGLVMRNTDQVNAMMLNLLDSHDTHRFLTQAGGERSRLLAALATLMLYPGAPCLYYGTELAMPGGYDPDCRRTFDWERAANPDGFFAAVKRLIRLKSIPAVQRGEARFGSENGLFCLERRSAGGAVRLACNRTDRSVPFRAEGRVIAENGLAGGSLAPDGFAVTEYE